jgi:hypothetical protein
MNVVDSSGWLEYFAEGPNTGFFAALIEDVDQLLVSAYQWPTASSWLQHMSLVPPFGHRTPIFLEFRVLSISPRVSSDRVL